MTLSSKSSKARAIWKSISTGASPISASSPPSTFSAPARVRMKLLLPPDELSRVWVLRKVLSPLSTVEAMELLISRLSKSKANMEFLSSMSAPA